MKWDEWKGDLKGNPTFWAKHLFTFCGWRWSIHKFVGRDEPDCYHSHPAVAYRLILWGRYTEAIVTDEYGAGWSIKEFKYWRMGNWGRVDPTMVHNICETSKVCYTLWIRGPKTHEILLIGSGWRKQVEDERVVDGDANHLHNGRSSSDI